MWRRFPTVGPTCQSLLSLLSPPSPPAESTPASRPPPPLESSAPASPAAARALLLVALAPLPELGQRLLRGDARGLGPGGGARAAGFDRRGDAASRWSLSCRARLLTAELEMWDEARPAGGAPAVGRCGRRRSSRRHGLAAGGAWARRGAGGSAAPSWRRRGVRAGRGGVHESAECGSSTPRWRRKGARVDGARAGQGDPRRCAEHGPAKRVE